MADHATVSPASAPLQGTLLVWTMSFDEHRATCRLAWVTAQYEAGVVIDEAVAISARADDVDEILRVADRWHARLCAAGWVPDNVGLTVRPMPDRRQPERSSPAPR